MLEKLQKIATALFVFKIPAFGMGVIGGIGTLYILFTSLSHEGDKLLIPSLILSFFSFSVYLFIDTFRHIPQQSKGTSILSDIKISLQRAWYWLVAMAFFVMLSLVILMSLKLLSYWLDGYGIF